jgi:hypothetical protein
MSKTHLTAAQVSEVRQALQVATLEALLASRRWQPGELVFQGGTSLHLAHGSPRFSEDLDFLVQSALKLDALAAGVQQRLAGTPWLPAGTALTVSKAKDGHNPHAFVVTVGGEAVIGAVRVKVELWQADKAAIEPLRVSVIPVRLASGPAAGAQAFVPTADRREIFVDKVFALGARPYLKPRDVFDLHWIQAREPAFECTVGDLCLRLATYPGETPEGWLMKAQERLEALPAHAEAVSRDLKRWLPSTWPIDSHVAAEMIDVSAAALRQGIAQMRLIAADPERTCNDDDAEPRAREAPRT